MLDRLRFRLLRRGLLFAAQRSGEHTKELLTSNPIGHHPLERTTNPVLILTNQINLGLCLAHALRGLHRCVGPDVASLEPAVGKVLHCVENLVLNVPETTRIVLKRGRIRHEHHTLHGLQWLCCIVHSVFLHHSTVTKKLGESKPLSRTVPELIPRSRDEYLCCPPPASRAIKWSNYTPRHCELRSGSRRSVGLLIVTLPAALIDQCRKLQSRSGDTAFASGFLADETKRGDRDVPFDRWADARNGGDAKSLRAASQTARTYL